MIAPRAKEDPVEYVCLILRNVKNLDIYHGKLFARLSIIESLSMKIKSGRKPEKMVVSVVGKDIMHF